MRDASLAVLREIGVETGGSNVQFAVDPATGRMIVIEMNPRVSRSSALASKATGFPIAKVAAKLAVGYTLDEIANDITGGATPASFEPSIDYVVTKVPRFAFEKFAGAEPILTTSMKSVGEAMAIGRTFAESLQKALRSTETGLDGLDEIEIEGATGGRARGPPTSLRAALGRPTPDRLLVVGQALRAGMAVRRDPTTPARSTRGSSRDWPRSSRSSDAYAPTASRPDAGNMRVLKAAGFSDARLASLARTDEAGRPPCAPRAGCAPGLQAHRHVRPPSSRRRPPTCIRPMPRPSPAPPAENEARPTDRAKIVILGGGPNRIGRASSSTIAAATPPSPCATRATRPSWSTATRRPSRPTTTRRTGSTSSR